MRIGVSLLNNQGITDARALVDLAPRAEELGFDSVWVHDHVFNVGHVLDRIGDKPYYEPLTFLSYVAARTERILLGTSVLVLPYHNPVRLAKSAATLDVLSGGRQPLGLAPDALGSAIASLRDEARACGRDIAKIPVSMSMTLGASTRGRFTLGKDPADIVRNAKAFADVGVQRLIISASTSDAREARAALEMVGREVLPAFR